MCWDSRSCFPTARWSIWVAKRSTLRATTCRGVFVGSEGTLGVATKIILRIVKRPECIQTLLAAFDSTNEAGAAVSGIIAAGMLPAAIEMMDTLAIQAAEAAVHADYPDCGGLLLVELDGPHGGSRSADAASEAKSARNAAPGKSAWHRRKRSAPWCGRAAKRPSPPWAAFRRTTSCRTASSRARRCRAS